LAPRFLYIGSLRTFRPLHNFKLDSLSFLQSTVAVANDSGIMNENVRAIVAPDEAVTLRVIEPFYCATQFGALPTLMYFFPDAAGRSFKETSTRNCAESSRTRAAVNENDRISVLKATNYVGINRFKQGQFR